MGRVRIEEGDLTAADVDAIVNAANTELKLGAGVAGAILRAGGPEVQRECDRLAPVRLGDAVLTGAGMMPARHVIHAAGMDPGGAVSEGSLRACTRRSLEIAAAAGLRTLAFPAIGTGIGGFSVQRCAEVMLEEIQRHLGGETSLEEVRLVLFGEPAYRVFEQVRDAVAIRNQMKKLRR